MLSVATYSQEYIDRCRAQIEADVTAYADLDRREVPLTRSVAMSPGAGVGLW
jgi:hypothetical protein